MGRGRTSFNVNMVFSWRHSMRESIVAGAELLKATLLLVKVET